MGDMSRMPRVKTRDGCRGGQEQFKWDSIKDQSFKDREQYLGASTKVGLMGKFAKYYVHDWYAKTRETTESIEDERSTVQAYEEELMQEALGVKPKRLMLQKRQLTEDEIKEYLKRDDDKREDQKGMQQMGPQKKIVTNELGHQVETSNEDVVAVAAREAPVRGIGFAAHRTAKLEAMKAEALGTESELTGVKPATSSSSAAVKDEVKGEVKKQEVDDNASALGVVDTKMEDVKDEFRAVKPKKEGKSKKEKKTTKEEKKRKKAEKKLKKVEKKLKKAAKKQQRVAKLAKGDRTKSSSSSSSSS